MKRLRVAIAEDEVLIADLLQQVVESSGHVVVGCARTGDELLGIVADQHPDLVLADVKLAHHSDGLAAASTAQRDFGVPAIAVTAHLTAEEVRRAGLFGFLPKPFTLAKLERTLASTAERLDAGAAPRASGGVRRSPAPGRLSERQDH